DDPVGGRPQTRRSGRGDTDDRPVVALVRIHPGPSGARLGLPAATRRGLRSAADPPPRRAAAVAAGAARIPAVRPPHLHRARARAAGDPAAQRRAAGGPGPRILPPPRLPARAAAAHRGPGALGRGVPAPVITDSLSGHGFPASHPSAVPARARTTVRRCRPRGRRIARAGLLAGDRDRRRRTSRQERGRGRPPGRLPRCAAHDTTERHGPAPPHTPPSRRPDRRCGSRRRSTGLRPRRGPPRRRGPPPPPRRRRAPPRVAHLVPLPTPRLNAPARPRPTPRRAAALTVDADRGAAQLAFDRAADCLVEAARSCGVAVLSIHDSFPGGELGHFATRLAEQGLIALVCGNSPALMAAYDSTEAVTGTNPLAFALPHSSGPRVFDQASSATAFVSIRQAAERGEHIPPGWALDADGQPTIDPAAA